MSPAGPAVHSPPPGLASTRWQVQCAEAAGPSAGAAQLTGPLQDRYSQSTWVSSTHVPHHLRRDPSCRATAEAEREGEGQCRWMEAVYGLVRAVPSHPWRGTNEDAAAD